MSRGGAKVAEDAADHLAYVGSPPLAVGCNPDIELAPADEDLATNPVAG